MVEVFDAATETPSGEISDARQRLLARVNPDQLLKEVLERSAYVAQVNEPQERAFVSASTPRVREALEAESGAIRLRALQELMKRDSFHVEDARSIIGEANLP